MITEELLTDPETLESSTHDRVIVIYHASCYDGFCAAWLLWQLFPDAEFYPRQYNDGQVLPDVTGAKVIIADFSFPRETMLSLIADSASLVCLDHHKTAEAELADLPGCFFDSNRSGARMVWDHFRSKLCRRFIDESYWLVDYTEDRDLWRWKLKDSREINAALRLVPFEFEAWDALKKCGSAILNRCTGETIDGATILAYLKSQAERQAHHCSYVDLKVGDEHYIAPIANVTDPNVISDVGQLLAEKVGLGITYFHDGEDFVYSLRSKGDIDCGDIARHFGGGGHKHAAGFRMDSFLPLTNDPKFEVKE